MNAWIMLIVAGVMEVGWAVGLKYTHGFTKLLPSALTISSMIMSMWLLGLSVRTIPLGTAYAVWVGIGVVGTAILGIILFEETFTMARMAFLTLLMVAIAGLKLTAPPL